MDLTKLTLKELSYKFNLNRINYLSAYYIEAEVGILFNNFIKKFDDIESEEARFIKAHRHLMIEKESELNTELESIIAEFERRGYEYSYKIRVDLLDTAPFVKEK